MSIADLRGHVTLAMKAARSAAMQGGAYGGDVARELEWRLVVVRDMANGKARAQNALAVRITAGCSIEQLNGERSSILLGVFDGHGKDGHWASHYVVRYALHQVMQVVIGKFTSNICWGGIPKGGRRSGPGPPLASLASDVLI